MLVIVVAAINPSISPTSIRSNNLAACSTNGSRSFDTLRPISYPLPGSFLTIAKTTVGRGCRDREKTGA